VIQGFLLIGAGALLVALGVGGWIGALPRNRWSGIRTRATMRGEREWQAAHAAGGPWIAVGGLCVVGAGLAFMESNSLWIAAFVVGIALVAIGGVIGHKAAQRVG
jgi:hypothetical protein